MPPDHDLAAESEKGTSDKGILDLLRRRGPMRINDLAEATSVTATAVRIRLVRLMDAGFVERTAEANGRGRPSHAYVITELGERQSGDNLADLALVLWEEIRRLPDEEVRRGFLKRVAGRLAELYAHRVTGEDTGQRMHSLAELFKEKEIPFDVEWDEANGERLPILTARACPYTEIADVDRSICSMEKMLFSELLGESLKLEQCQLAGEDCCTFVAR